MARFEAAGLKVKYVTSDGLELDSETHSKSAKAFGASLILLLSPDGGTVSNQVIVNAKYRVSGYDLNQGRMVYKATIDFRPYQELMLLGIVWNKETADKLADDIYTNAHSKGLL